MTTIILVLKKIESDIKTKYDTFYSNSKAKIIISESDIDDLFESIYTTIISNIQKSLRNGPDWIVDSVIEHNISISKYNLLAGSSYIKLPKELDYPRKKLINIQNINNNECFKYLNSSDHHLSRITKANKYFTKKLNFKDFKLKFKI